MTYSVIEMAELLNVTVNVVYKAVHELQMVRSSSDKKKYLYSMEQYMQLKEHVRVRPEGLKYYPIKTTETFYIYQSSMNN